MRFSVDGIELAYEVHGHGPPLLFIPGLAFGGWSWYRQVPALAPRHTVILLDNRGAGASDKPDAPYSISRMADDAAALLDHLDVRRAGVVGISMGGYIAQELALRHPDRVSRLVLGCTSYGGPHVPHLGLATLQQMLAEMGAPDDQELARRGLSLRFGEDWIRDSPDELAEFLRRRDGQRPPLFAWHRQAMAGRDFDAEARVAAIRVPTLVVTGDADAIVPPECSELLAARIPGAWLERYAGRRHLFFIDGAARFNEDVKAFFG